MAELPLNHNWVIPEFGTSHNKDILVVWFSANEPENTNPEKRLTMVHLAAIIKSDKLLEDSLRYQDLKINPDQLVDHACWLNGLINQLNYILQDASDCGLNFEALGGKNKWILMILKETYPEVNENKLKEGYELVEFLDLLKGGVNYESQYLSILKEKLAKVSDAIKKEYSINEL